jgi:hypothetical protein
MTTTVPSLRASRRRRLAMEKAAATLEEMKRGVALHLSYTR